MARVILEAKKDSRKLELQPRTSGKSFRLNGPIFTSATIKEGIEQAIRYCGQKNAELACVTNGFEWLIFRGSRLGDGQDTLSGTAFVYGSLEEIKNNFAQFYDLLSFESVNEFKYRAVFQEAEGRVIRRQVRRRSLRSPSSKRLLRGGDNHLSGDLDRIMTSFFRRLTGDDDQDLMTYSSGQAPRYLTEGQSHHTNLAALRTRVDNRAILV